MFAVGHLSLGYLFAKGAAKLLKQEINLPLIFLLALIPDIDLLIPGVEHRTITHSLITAAVIFVPLLIQYRRRALPYFIALAQHSLVGDFIIGETQLLWPITSTWYGLGISIFSPTNIIVEWSSFLVAVAIMLKTKDLHNLLKGQLLHLSLSVPILTVLLPAFIHFPLSVPLPLLIPHLAYFALFILSIVNILKSLLSQSE
jgi:membrane-bound metal-dependent hydrolase YbcI (DUF457 family)